LVPEAQVLIDGTTKTNCTNPLPGACGQADVGLESPQGLAIWHGKERADLFVADPGLKKIFKYQLGGSALQDDAAAVGTMQVGAQTRVLDVANVYGLALDGYGNLYYTTSDGAVGMLTARDGQVTADSKNTVLYAVENEGSVSKPGALAADSFFVYWANQENGQAAGTLVKGFERDPAKLKAQYKDYPKKISNNIAKAMGVCVARSNVFFTAEAKSLFAVKATGDGGTLAEVSSDMKAPRGCTYDGDNTLYVADSQEGAVYSLAANYKTLRATKRLQKVAKVTAPEQVTVFTSAPAYAGDLSLESGVASPMPLAWIALLTWTVAVHV
jgi:hypothetical protein